MVSQDENVNIYFILPEKCSSEKECSEEMWQAFNKCMEHDLGPEWIRESECSYMKPRKNDVLIMEEFKGEVFKQLKASKCSIIGPMCLLICFLNKEPIPEGSSPVFTTPMRGLCICASGLLPEEKEHVEELVEYMGGYFTKQLRTSVTHLVTGSVMSVKYESALEMKIPVVTKEWVDAVWETNLKKYVKATDSMFDKYMAPVFLNLVVTSTNLKRPQKEQIKELINTHGGTFMGALDGTRVKVVIAPENCPTSEKLKFAKRSNIACLTPNWVYESIKIGYSLPFKNYIIKSSKACSTPEKSTAHETFNCSAISSISCEVQQQNYVNESVASTVNNCSPMESINTHTPISVLDRLTLNDAKLAGPFLDGCNVYLAGFASNQRDKLNRILNVGSATRLDDISDALTHVIIGDEKKASGELKLMKSKGLCPYMLTVDWLEECMKLKQRAPEENFLYEYNDKPCEPSAEAPSPLSKKNLQMLQKPRRPPIPAFNIDKKLAAMEKKTEPDLVQQYLQESAVSAGDTTMRELFKSSSSAFEDKNKTLTTPNKNHTQNNSLSYATNKTSADDSAIPISQTSTACEKIFDGLTFVVTGFTDDEQCIVESITGMGGFVVPRAFAGIPDYGVVPKCGAPLKHTVNEIVTDLYIEDCLNQEQMVDIEYYHRPLSIKKNVKPLSGCVITMSVYTGAERTYLATLATGLGAMCQDVFARKTNVDKNIYGSTHLICPTPEGSKYSAAVKWNLPCVTADWLKSCAVQSKLLDETPYLVGETMAPERPPEPPAADADSSLSKTIKMGPPTEATPRTILTPKRHLPQLQDLENSSADTPIINKRLSLVMNKTAQSPFQTATPETPYGQVFKPNPSPDTRKGWIKWVDNFPDLRVEEPPLKRRAPSTPLSDLKKQLWEKLKNQGHSHEEGDADKSNVTNDHKTPLQTSKKDDYSDDCEKGNDGMPINRKLEFVDEANLAQNNEINLQLAQLHEVLQKTSSTPERKSLSGESNYSAEPADHVETCITKDTQPTDTIVWEDPNHPKRPSLSVEATQDEELSLKVESIEEPVTKKRFKFMLSGVKEREAYEQVIQDLGGEVSTDPNFDETATHLLCIRPSRNEKMLGSIATGKWVLHCLYLQSCEQEGKFTDEEPYEWGNPKSKDIIPNPSNDTEKAIAAAAHRWRLKLMKQPYGPFHGMVAIIMVINERYDQFKRLIEAGGGTVVQAKPPYDTSPGKKITHCFVNVRHVNQPIDWAMLANKGIYCLLPQFLSDQLTAETPCNPRECVVPEFKKYLPLMPK